MRISFGGHEQAVAGVSLIDGQRVCFAVPLNNLGFEADDLLDPSDVARQLLRVARLFDDGADLALIGENAEFIVRVGDARETEQLVRRLAPYFETDDAIRTEFIARAGRDAPAEALVDQFMFHQTTGPRDAFFRSAFSTRLGIEIFCSKNAVVVPPGTDVAAFMRRWDGLRESADKFVSGTVCVDAVMLPSGDRVEFSAEEYADAKRLARRLSWPVVRGRHRRASADAATGLVSIVDASVVFFHFGSRPRGFAF